MKKSTTTNSSRFIIYSTLLVVSHLLIIYYIKYDVNNLSLSSFNYSFVGNWINFIISLTYLMGLVVFVFSKKKINTKQTKLIYSALVISILSLVSVFIVFKLKLFNTPGLILNFPIQKVYTGFLLVISQYFIVFISIYLWGIILGAETYYELRTLVRSLMAVGVLLLFTLFYVWNVKHYSENNIYGIRFNYGMVPGAAVYSKGKPSPIFEARIRKSFDLYRNNSFDKFILTGGNAPGEISESVSAKNYLVNLGVNSQNILIEDHTSTSAEQVRYISNTSELSVHNGKLLVISDGFHLSRVLQICKFYNIDAYGIASDYKISFEKTLYYRTRESVALLMFWLFAV